MASLLVNGVCTLTRDSDIIKSKDKKAAWLHFGVAAHRRFAKPGYQEADFFDVEYYMKNPDSGIENMLKKGTIIYLDRAELRSDKYSDKNGIERTKMKIMIYSFDIIERSNKIEAEPEKPTIKEDNNEEFVADPDEEIPF